MDDLSHLLKIDASKDSHHFHRTYYVQETNQKREALAALERMRIALHHQAHIRASNRLYDSAGPLLPISEESDDSSWSSDNEELSGDDSSSNDEVLEALESANSDTKKRKATETTEGRPLKRLRRLGDQ